MTAGNLVVRKCVFSSHTHAAVEVRGDKAAPTFEDCDVRACIDDGFIFTEKAQGTVKGGKVNEARGVGISILGGAAPVISEIDVYNCTAGGCVISGDGTRGQLTSVRLQNNTIGVLVKHKADPLLTFLKVLESDGTGVLFDGGAKGRLENSELKRCETGAVIQGGADPSITGCARRGGTRTRRIVCWVFFATPTPHLTTPCAPH